MRKLYIVEISICVAILNIIDGIFTSFGLSRQYIDELNPLMKLLTTYSTTLFIALKCFLSVLIVYIAIKIIKGRNSSFKKLFYAGLIFVFILYTGIFSMHLLWISQI